MAAGTCLLAYLDGELQLLDSLSSALRGERSMWLLDAEAICPSSLVYVVSFLEKSQDHVQVPHSQPKRPLLRTQVTPAKVGQVTASSSPCLGLGSSGDMTAYRRSCRDC